MNRHALIAKYNNLPIKAQKQVDVFIDSLSKKPAVKPGRSLKRRFKFDWAGGLVDIKDRFTAVRLQHQLGGSR